MVPTEPQIRCLLSHRHCRHPTASCSAGPPYLSPQTSKPTHIPRHTSKPRQRHCKEPWLCAPNSSRDLSWDLPTAVSEPAPARYQGCLCITLMDKNLNSSVDPPSCCCWCISSPCVAPKPAMPMQSNIIQLNVRAPNPSSVLKRQ